MVDNIVIGIGRVTSCDAGYLILDYLYVVEVSG